jgi:tRNA(Ile)-lysidine synthase
MVVEKIKDYLLTYLQGATKIAVAVSGGADSMALTLMLQDFAASHSLELHALHVDHNLRNESAKEAIIVQSRLTSHNINCHILTSETLIQEMQGNLMQNARMVRYDLMLQYCQANEISYLATAHHMEDVVETFLMRLGRGSGVDGLSSIKSFSQMQNINIIRPLLNISKIELKNYLLQRGIEWINDPTNQNPRFTRTKMRELIPIMNEYGVKAERVALAVSHIARASDFLQIQAKAWLEDNAAINEYSIIIPSDLWINLHHEMQLRTLSQALKSLSPQKCELRFAKLEYLRQNMLSPLTFKGQSLHYCQITYDNDQYIIVKST